MVTPNKDYTAENYAESNTQRLRRDVVAFYLGDDITDEDAFLALKRLGATSASAHSGGGGGGGGEDTGSNSSSSSGGSGSSMVGSARASPRIVGEEKSEAALGGSHPSVGLANGGVGILVRRDGDGERSAASHASLKLQDTDEVRRFLELLVEAAEMG